MQVPKMPIVQIGKSGVTDAQVVELKKQLKKHKLIKIRFLRSFVSDAKVPVKQHAEILASKAEAVLLKSVGYTAILKYKS